jgi:hypothetical protein
VIGVGNIAEHPSEDSVNVRFVKPAATPVTTPAFVTVATAVLLLAHTPGITGLTVTVVLSPIQILGTATDKLGEGTTVTGSEGKDGQSVALLVNINVVNPGATPVTKPAFVIVAIAEFPDDHTPTAAGLGAKLVVVPTQIESFPVIFITGRAFTTMSIVSEHCVAVDKNLILPVPASKPVTVGTGEAE